jgi:hypothetical protein
MTRTPGEFGSPKPMTKAEREARKAFRQGDAKKGVTEYEVAQRAFHANRERLKAERLAREAAETPVAAKKANPTCAESTLHNNQINGLAKKLALHFWSEGRGSGAACERCPLVFGEPHALR